jgi:hypothetical protein
MHHVRVANYEFGDGRVVISYRTRCPTPLNAIVAALEVCAARRVVGPTRRSEVHNA